MITDGSKWHYLAVSSLSALLTKKSSNHEGNLYSLGCFNSYTTKNRLNEHEKICNKGDSCRIEMPKWTKKTLKYARGEKSLKAQFAIYLDLECLLKKKQSCQNNPKKSYTEKKAVHESSGLCLQNFHLTKQKINSIITEEGIVLKNCVKSQKSMQ